MLNQYIHSGASYRFHQIELKALLKKAGITDSGLPLLAGAGSKKNIIQPAALNTGQQVGRVIFYMDQHLTEELNLEKLAEEAGLSKYQLIRRFREEAGTTPWKFLMRKRIDKVKELLENGIAPAPAAVEAGFYDQSHLNKVFREETGMTPKEYQEKNFINRN